ncbi:hypothetical protein [Gloeobacter morelensis]|uniref:Uncharacterized protein n=1 Tax=Gloeobacter morelensis MG652769 TaxID=2781736 RepID=A0ABY3PLC5_9CYAN|nr:hypothetical protein [Gloeobacter morelensis]UFP94384.1 hypothetical protein ISF26_22010 [Gloeobacter morelensis MG652769]
MSKVGRLIIRATEGWFIVEGSLQGEQPPHVELHPERPPIHLQDVVVGARVAGGRSYAEDTLLMHIFRLWRTRWLERGDLLVIQAEELALISNQSAIPGEPEVRLLTLVHPDVDPQNMARVRNCIERLQRSRRTFGLGLARYRHDYLQSLGVEPLPLSSRYRVAETGSLWHHILLNYPEAVLCCEPQGRQCSQGRVCPGSRRPDAHQMTGESP